MKYKFKKGDGFIGTKEERKILQRLIIKNKYPSTPGFQDIIGGNDFYWNGDEFYLSATSKIIPNPIPFEEFKRILNNEKLYYEIY